MDENRYILLNRQEDFPADSMEGLSYADSCLTLEGSCKEGIFLTKLMDSTESQCHWQRIKLSSKIPAGALITCSVYLVDDPSHLRFVEDVMQSGRALQEKKQLIDSHRVLTVNNASDFLIGEDRGRYLLLCIEMSIQTDDAPKINYIQAWCRQMTFESFLPEIYRNEGGFLDRFLSIFGTQYLDIENMLQWIARRFDPKTAPPSVLRDLARLVNIDRIYLWETEALRALIIEDVYALKGTPHGIKRLVEIFTGCRASVVERFRMVTGIEENDRLYNADLVILINADHKLSLDKERNIHMLLQDFIPAGLSYTLLRLPDTILMSEYSYLDVNSRLTGYTPAACDGLDGLDYIIIGE